MLILWTIYSSLLFALTFSEEIITFQNEEYYLCTVDTFKKTIYVDPASPTDPRNSSILIENNDLWNDDWSLKDSMKIVAPGVTDKRWEDFGTIYSNDVHFESVASYGHSVKANHVQVVMTDLGQKPEKKEFSSDLKLNTDHWSHSNTHAVDGSLFDIYAYTPADTYWKIHQCAHCTMNVTISDSEEHYLQSKDKKWQTLKIETHREKNIKLTRGRTDNSESGEWVIDIRKCPKAMGNRTTFKIDLTPNDTINRTCKTFPFTQTRVDGSIWMSINPTETIFDCEAGTLGRNCDVMCEDFLGPKYKRCEKHKICDNSSFNSKCFCAWGFKGASCNEECSDGTWGMSCQNRCKNCNKCDKVTGKCNRK